MSLFHRHRVRATFYHAIAAIFILMTAGWMLGLISDTMSFYISASLFIIDYIAEMYDPHPESPGPWFKAHFHRFFDGDTKDESKKCKVAAFLEKGNEVGTWLDKQA